MKKVISILLMGISFSVFTQGNCLLYSKESNEYKACKLAEKALKFKQGSKESQILFDSVIKLNPKYAWAYKEKSVPYFKRGFILEGLKLLNKAVELKPERHLTYRAYWYFQNGNYKKCIEDLETYFALPNSYLNELTPGGDMDMRLLLGMSYAKQGKVKKAVLTVEKAINSYKEADFGELDYHILGMLYFKNKQYDKALKSLQKQLKINNIYFDTYYYLGLTYNKLGKSKQAKKEFERALFVYTNPYRMKNGYPCFRVYKLDVERELYNFKFEFTQKIK